MPPKPNPPKRRAHDARSWTKYMGIGVQLAGTIGACVLLGLFLDGQFDSSPWLTVALAVIGVVGGLYVSVRDLL